MPDLFEGFRWREVAAVVLCMVFFVTIIIQSVRDIDDVRRTEDTSLRKRIEKLEIMMVAQQCLDNPELCRAIRRGDAP